ncbi:hypothetical protein RB596_009493 [Gaeumannomyces avenae]
MRLNILASLAAVAPLAACHGAVTSYEIGGVKYPGYEGFSPNSSPKTIQFQWPNYDPVMNPADAKMRCNGGTRADLVAPVKAGTNITAFWKQWTHAQGPVTVWLYRCEGAHGSSACRGDGKGWFKIDEMGMWGGKLNSENWGTAIVLKTGKWSSKIPANIKPGNYLIRHELLALHQSNTPQFYPECAQIEIQGAGTALPPDTHKFSIPTYAPMSDPGVRVSVPGGVLPLLRGASRRPSWGVEETFVGRRGDMFADTWLLGSQIDIYSSKATEYKVPGGPVWTGFN